MSGHKNGPTDKTRNFKKFRLWITYPGKSPKFFSHSSKKVLRPTIQRNVSKGARVEEQKHLGYGAYRTIAVHEPYNATARPGVPR